MALYFTHNYNELYVIIILHLLIKTQEFYDFLYRITVPCDATSHTVGRSCRHGEQPVEDRTKRLYVSKTFLRKRAQAQAKIISTQGKTTFCNLVTALHAPTKGTIEIDGKIADPKIQNISFVFQEPSGLPWKTIYQNVRYALEIKDQISNEEMDNKVNKTLELVNLAEFKDYYPHEISAGMKQRLAIARGFVTEPDLLLMDEPFGQLDLKTRFHMMDAVLKLWENSNATIIYVTHNLEEAVYLAQDIMVLSQKPTKVKQMVSVSHLPHPRDYADPEFVKIREQVTELVKWW